MSMKPSTQTASASGVLPPVFTNWKATPFNLALFADFTTGTGIGTVTIEHSPTDPAGLTAATYASTAIWYSTEGLTSVTATDESNIAFPVRAVRMNVTAYTSGDIDFTVIQAN